MFLRHRPDFSPEGWGRVVLFTIVGTVFCMAVAFAIDGYSNDWNWGRTPLNNIVIPLVLAPPFFVYLLSKLRQLALAHRALTIVASIDELTGCLNRRAFTTRAEGYLDRSARYGLNVEGALLILDVDHFKTVNDRFGHAWGDEALKIIARTIELSVRDEDVVGRIGGEEFGILLSGLAAGEAESGAERIRLAIHQAEFSPRGRRHALSASLGGATFMRGASFSELFRLADHWLYVAKQNGRNRVEVHAAAAGDPPPTRAAGSTAQAMLH
jgi:diguanylate cyclase